MDIEVELKPHVGVMNTPLGKQTVEHEQWMVYANGKHVGYLGKPSGSHFNLCVTLPKETQIALSEQVQSAANLEWDKAHDVSTAMVPAVPDGTEDESED